MPACPLVTASSAPPPVTIEIPSLSAFHLQSSHIRQRVKRKPDVPCLFVPPLNHEISSNELGWKVHLSKGADPMTPINLSAGPAEHRILYQRREDQIRSRASAAAHHHLVMAMRSWRSLGFMLRLPPFLRQPFPLGRGTRQGVQDDPGGMIEVDA